MTGSGGTQAVEEFPSWEGPGKGPSKRRKQRDRRRGAEVGMRAARVEGLRKEPDRLETVCSFRGPPGSLMVRTWSQSGNEILQKRKKIGRIRRRRANRRFRSALLGGLGRGDGLTKEMCILKIYVENVKGFLMEKPQMLEIVSWLGREVLSFSRSPID